MYFSFKRVSLYLSLHLALHLDLATREHQQRALEKPKAAVCEGHIEIEFRHSFRDVGNPGIHEAVIPGSEKKATLRLGPADEAPVTFAAL